MTENHRVYLLDFLKASAVCFLFLLWAFHLPLLKGEVSSFGAVFPAAQGIGDMNEQMTQLQPGLLTQAKLVRQGIFPAWNPYPNGGTPLLGKMMSATFSPLNLPFYLLPLSLFPYVLMLVVALKAQLAYSFTYLYGRAIGLRWASAVFAGILFTFSPRMFPEALFATWGSALYLPFLLLLVEMFFGGKSRAALWLAPWAAALPILGGHFESAIRVEVVAALYFLIRRRQEMKRGRAVPWRDAVGLALSGCLGLGIAGCQALAGSEYVGLSYNKAWRTLAEYGWYYHTSGKHYSSEDLALVATGWAMAGLFVFLMKRALSSPRPSYGGFTAATATLTLMLALLGHLGMSDTLLGVVSFPSAGFEMGKWLCGLFLAFWAASEFGRERTDAIRALGYILIGSVLVVCKTPPIANLLASAPIVGLFNNAVYFHEYQLALVVICAAGLDRALNPSDPAPKIDILAVQRASAICVVLAVAYVGASPLKNLVASHVTTGIWPASAAGGIMGAEDRVTFEERQVISGWVPEDPAAVLVGRIEGNSLVATVPAKIRRYGSRSYFEASIVINEGFQRIAALIQPASGASRYLKGPQIQRSEKRPAWLLFGAALAAAILFPLLGHAALRLLWLPLLAACVWNIAATSMPASELPYRLPGIEAIRKDPALFRISSFSQDNFLRADYANLYGIADIRNGGDNLDVLSMIYFIFFTSPLLADGRDIASQEMGLKMLGLANVKYLIDRPHKARSQPGLEKIYDGDEMSVYRNKYARERAFFFEDFVDVPVPRLSDWKNRNDVLRAVGSAVSAKGFDLDRTLVLHDAPAPSPAPGRGLAAQARVTMERYEPQIVRVLIDAPRAGFLFFGDNAFPGWRARLNGSPVKILRSWLTFRAVQVPAGRSTVEFTYEPRGLWAAVALGSLLALGWALLYLLRPAPGPEVAPPSPQHSKKTKKALAASLPVVPSESLAANSLIGETLLIGVVATCILFWSAWAAFVHRGLFAVNALGGAALLCLAAAAVARLRRL